MRGILLLSALLVGWHTAQAGGFMIGEMSARSTGMASAFTAVADDASAAWHNPAGVAFTEGSQLMTGGAMILTKGSYASNASTKSAGGAAVNNAVDAKDKTFIVPHAYFTYWNKGSKIGGSLSINAPFGLETEWPDTAAFSSKNTFSRIQSLNINPSVVLKVSDRFAVAVGIDFAHVGKVDLNNTLQTLTGDGHGWGGNVSVLFKGDSFNIGAMYRSRIKADIEGTVTAVPGKTLATLGGTTSAATTSLTFPDQFNVGLALMPSDQLTISLDVDWVNWKTYDSIDITYASAAYRTAVSNLQGAVGATKTGKTILPQNWKATTAFRAGLEWQFNPKMRVRLGYVFDPTPVNDHDFSPSVPGNDRHIFSTGMGYDITPAATIDVAYAYVSLNDRDQTLSPATPTGAPDTVKNGAYKLNAHVLMASLNYRF